MLLCFDTSANTCAWDEKVKDVKKLQQLKYIYQHFSNFMINLLTMVDSLSCHSRLSGILLIPP